jgi:uncharacterized membrane protein
VLVVGLFRSASTSFSNTSCSANFCISSSYANPPPLPFTFLYQVTPFFSTLPSCYQCMHLLPLGGMHPTLFPFISSPLSLTSPFRTFVVASLIIISLPVSLFQVHSSSFWIPVGINEFSCFFHFHHLHDALVFITRIRSVSVLAWSGHLSRDT